MDVQKRSVSGASPAPIYSETLADFHFVRTMEMEGVRPLEEDTGRPNSDLSEPR